MEETATTEGAVADIGTRDERTGCGRQVEPERTRVADRIGPVVRAGASTGGLHEASHAEPAHRVVFSHVGVGEVEVNKSNVERTGDKSRAQNASC